jgi:hypothetical protein|tara:strand:+ start:184 stop:1122 length:939 start_codon:yes stop_codon:yes gene_type:complete
VSGDVKFQFSGHETFALRYGWLKKVVDALTSKTRPSESTIFSSEEAIAYFGVGKNMVSSMRHWALSCEIIEHVEKNIFNISELGDFLFSDCKGVDPYLENSASLWLLHWKLISRLARSTTWHFAFHQFSRNLFDRQILASEIRALCHENGQTKVADKTFQRDVECFLNTYVMRRGKNDYFGEETLECPLAELFLISETAQKGVFEFQIGPKPSLPDAVFNYALLEFAQRSGTGATLSLEHVTYDPGSPGRGFRLDENSVADRLLGIEKSSKGAFVWSETAGLRQVHVKLPDLSPLELIKPAYAGSQLKAVAA